MKKFFALAVALIASASAFAFQPGMSTKAIDAEVHQRAAKGESLGVQTAAAKIAGVPAGTMSCALVSTNNTAASVVAAMVRAGFSGPDVVNGALCMGGDRVALNQAAIGAGADPTALLAATAAGGGQAAGPATPSTGQFNGASFGQSRAATVGGGGRSSVSRS